MAADLDVDVLVVGYGGAGAAAAIAAHDLGARVLVVERSATGGGSTRASGGNIRLVVDVSTAVEHFAQLVGAGVDRATVTTFVSELVGLPQWLRDIGLDLRPNDEFSEQAMGVHRPGSAFPNIPGAGGLGSRLKPTAPGCAYGGEALWGVLTANVERRGLPVRYHTRARRLLVEAGAVRGAFVEENGARRVVRAGSGVILACGGFEWAADLLEDWVGAALPATSPADLNAGDGIRMAGAVGAQMWHMSCVTARYGFRIDGYPAGFTSSPPAQGLFVVDQRGTRYMDETAIDGHSGSLTMVVRDPVTGLHERLPSFMVFDEATRRAGPIGRQRSGHNRSYQWSADNTREIEAGWIHRAGSWPELAAEIGVPAPELERSAHLFNHAVEHDDDAFGRPARLMAPVAMAPYYAIALWPVLLNTQGGPRRDAGCRIVDMHGVPIEGLFGAGELGSIWGPAYPGAVNVAEALISGRQAAVSAVSGGARTGLAANTAKIVR